MPSTSYLPATFVGFADWLANFSTLLTASPTTYGLTPTDATAVAAQNTSYQAAYTAASDPTTRTSVTVAAQSAARTAAEAVVRPLAVSISLNSGVTDDDKVAIGVTVRKMVPTPVPPPLTFPTLSLVAGAHLQHTLTYRDSATPTSKAKPPGVTGIEIWRSVGAVPSTDPSQATFYTRWTKAPNVSTFDPPDVGKVCTYWARWVTQGGPGGAQQSGPWAPPLNLTVM
jgi:hypothetical protein